MFVPFFSVKCLVLFVWHFFVWRQCRFSLSKLYFFYLNTNVKRRKVETENRTSEFARMDGLDLFYITEQVRGNAGLYGLSPDSGCHENCCCKFKKLYSFWIVASLCSLMVNGMMVSVFKCDKASLQIGIVEFQADYILRNVCDEMYSKLENDSTLRWISDEICVRKTIPNITIIVNENTYDVWLCAHTSVRLLFQKWTTRKANSDPDSSMTTWTWRRRCTNPKCTNHISNFE